MSEGAQKDDTGDASLLHADADEPAVSDNVTDPIAARHQLRLGLPEAAIRPIRLRTDREIREHIPAPDLVDGLIQVGSVNQLFAPKNHFKSFLGIDLSYAIAAGRPTFLGRTIVKHGPVAILFAEGAGRLGPRIQAWCDANEINGYLNNVRICPEPISLLDPNQVESIAKALKKDFPDGLALITIDTLSQNASGADENSSRDMGRILAACQYLRQVLRTTVLVIHHPGKADSTVERGSSAFSAGCDAVLRVRRDNGVYYLVIKHIRDGAFLDDIPFTARVVEVPRYRNHRGYPLSTCIIQPLLTVEERTAVENEARDLSGRIVNVIQSAGSEGISGNRIVATVHTRSTTVRSLLHDLVDRGIIHVRGRGPARRYVATNLDRVALDPNEADTANIGDQGRDGNPNVVSLAVEQGRRRTRLRRGRREGTSAARQGNRSGALESDLRSRP